VGNSFVPLTGFQTSVFDPFNRASLNTGGPCATGSCWTLGLVGNSSGVTISGNRLQSTGGTGITSEFFSPVTAASLTNNVQVSASLIALGTGNNGTGGPALIFSETSGGHFIGQGWLCDNLSNNLELRRISNGFSTTVVTSTAQTFVAGEQLQLQMSATNTFTCVATVPGTSTQVSTTPIFDGTFTGNLFPGVALYENASTPAILDNWSYGSLNPLAELNREQDFTAPQHVFALTLGSSSPVAGALTAGDLYSSQWATSSTLCTDTNGKAITGCPLTAPSYATRSTTSTGNISAVTMTTAPASTPGSSYHLDWTISLTALGVGCTGSTTVTLNAIFTDPNVSSAITEALGTITIAASGNGVVGFVAQGSDNIYAKASTAVQYSTSGYTLGTGCSTNPTYQLTPVLTLSASPVL
jgi:hypothetical protein